MVSRRNRRPEAEKMAKVKDTLENFKICMQVNCSSCPSFLKGKGEGLYCARGKNECEIERKGCDCPECSVWLESGLSGMYYCAQGSAS